MKNNFLGKIICFYVLLNILVINAESSDVVFSWHSNRKKIALTFDDGPHPIHTPEILDILSEYGIHATFFIIGENAEWNEELLRRELKEGHEIGNHTYSHMNLKKLSYDDMKKEIEEAEKAIYETLEYRTKLLRPPGGNFGSDLCRAASELDYTVVCWSVDTLDWAHTPSDKIVENVLSNTKEGDIILFHDFVSGDSPTPDALKKIIPALIDEGYTFVTVSELINSN